MRDADLDVIEAAHDPFVDDLAYMRNEAAYLAVPLSDKRQDRKRRRILKDAWLIIGDLAEDSMQGAPWLCHCGCDCGHPAYGVIGHG